MISTPALTSTRPRMPAWLRRTATSAGSKAMVEGTLKNRGLHTVCEEARCPNRGECFSNGTATFLIMGDVCTRNCRFCHVTSGTTQPLDPFEGERLCEAIATLKLSYIVITSVTRDDLPDGGAAHFAMVTQSIKKAFPELHVELLIPDLQGNKNGLHIILDSGVGVLNHNIETVERLYPVVRPSANYQQSLLVLKETALYNRSVYRKSGIMVGLGETENEIISLMKDLVASDCQILTIGQYLQPSPSQIEVTEFIHPEQFARYETIGKEFGLLEVIAGPYVRSSYRAQEVSRKVQRSYSASTHTSHQ